MYSRHTCKNAVYVCKTHLAFPELSIVCKILRSQTDTRLTAKYRENYHKAQRRRHIGKGKAAV